MKKNNENSCSAGSSYPARILIKKLDLRKATIDNILSIWALGTSRPMKDLKNPSFFEVVITLRKQARFTMNHYRHFKHEYKNIIDQCYEANKNIEHLSRLGS